MKIRSAEENKKLLRLEWIVGGGCSLVFFALIFVAAYVNMPIWLKVALIVFGACGLCVGVFLALKIEQIAGYYECKNCKNRYVPKYSDMFWAMHYGRTRYLRCPKCNQKSWNKKVLTK